MSISFGRKSNVKAGLAAELRLEDDSSLPETHARLIDVRSPEAFKAGFIPGSYSVPDLDCMAAARRRGLFLGYRIYLLADDIDQVPLFQEACAPADSANFRGWFGPGAIQEWQKINAEIGVLETITPETLEMRMALATILMLNVHNGSGQPPAGHPAALSFGIEELPLALEGLPVESAICVTAATRSLASFAASLLWNFGFHKLSVR